MTSERNLLNLYPVVNLFVNSGLTYKMGIATQVAEKIRESASSHFQLFDTTHKKSH